MESRSLTFRNESDDDALIGFTGFVGGNLDRARPFRHRFNSANIESMAGREFATVFCAGTTAEKWRANQDPANDRTGVSRLWEVLHTVVAKSVVLISTVDVYPVPRGVDESSGIDLDDCHPYGRHRLELERRVTDRFNAVVLRLPGLFGPGLKKNALFDLLHDHDTQLIDSRGAFQFFDVTALSGLIDNARAAGLSLLNVATEPVSIAEVAENCFGASFVNHVGVLPAKYDIRSEHASLLGGHSGYLMSRSEVKDGIRNWVDRERGAGN